MGLSSLVRPDARVASVCDMTPEWLAEREIDAVLLDLDNTLAPWRAHELPSHVREWLDKVRAAGVKVCLLSNSRTPRRVRQVAETVGMPFVAWAGKPRRGGFGRALVVLGKTDARGVAMAGDQLLTDVVGAHRSGLYAVLVERMTGAEFIGTRWVRVLERWLLRRYGPPAPTGRVCPHPGPPPEGEGRGTDQAEGEASS